MATKLTPSTPLFTQAIEAVKVIQELPFSAFNISIERRTPALSLTGQPQVVYRIQRPGAQGGTHISLSSNNGKIDDLLISSTIQLKDWQGRCSLAARWSVAGEWGMQISEVGTIGDGEWEVKTNIEGRVHKAPAQATYDACRATLFSVAQRLLSRIQRVDLL